MGALHRAGHLELGGDIAVNTLAGIVEAILAADTAAAERLLDQVQRESPDNTFATVSSCISICLGLLDDTLRTANAPIVTLPAGHWNGERAAIDILALARRGSPSGPSRNC